MSHSISLILSFFYFRYKLYSTSPAQVNAFLERMSRERLIEKFGDSMDVEKIDLAAKVAEQDAKHRLEELAILSRFKRRSTQKGLDEVVEELIDEGVLSRTENGGVTVVTDPETGENDPTSVYAYNARMAAAALLYKKSQLSDDGADENDEQVEAIPEQDDDTPNNVVPLRDAA